jgi:hypothetical protein
MVRCSFCQGKGRVEEFGCPCCLGEGRLEKELHDEAPDPGEDRLERPRHENTFNRTSLYAIRKLKQLKVRRQRNVVALVLLNQALCGNEIPELKRVA